MLWPVSHGHAFFVNINIAFALEVHPATTGRMNGHCIDKAQGGRFCFTGTRTADEQHAQVENVRRDHGHLDWRWPVWIADLQGWPQAPAGFRWPGFVFARGSQQRKHCGQDEKQKTPGQPCVHEVDRAEQVQRENGEHDQKDDFHVFHSALRVNTSAGRQSFRMRARCLSAFSSSVLTTKNPCATSHILRPVASGQYFLLGTCRRVHERLIRSDPIRQSSSSTNQVLPAPSVAACSPCPVLNPCLSKVGLDRK